MAPLSSSSRTIRFGKFDADVHSGELRKHGTRIKLQVQPFQVLQALLERPGQVVTREELQKRIWPADTFVDFDHGLNNAIRKLRDALTDDAENPRYIETLAKRGYRFIAEVHNANGAAVSHIEAPAAAAAPSITSAPATRQRGYFWSLGLATVAVALAIVLVLHQNGLRDRSPGNGAAPHIESLAVLPLQNLSADPAQEYFSDGMTDALITDLAQIGSVRVISRTSSVQYKGMKKSLPEIARELNVDGIVEGTVQRSGDRVRITAQLIYGPADKHLWAHSYDRELRDALQLQGEVARDIAQNISVNVAGLSPQRPATPHPLNIEAYDDFLKGRNLVSRQTNVEVAEGKELLERSIHLDPDFAPAYASLASAYYVMTLVDQAPQPINIEKSVSAARKALMLDDNVAEAHCLLGLIYSMHDWNWASGEKEFRRAIQSNPGSAFAHSQFALFLVTTGRNPEAIQEINTALELDPFSPMQHSSASFVFLYARQYDLAMREARRAVEIDPSFSSGHLALGSVLHASGKPDEAFRKLLRYLSLSGQPAFAKKLETAERNTPGTGEPLQRVAPLFLATYKKKPEMQPAWAVILAWAFMYRGDKDKAFEWLNRACDEHSMEVYAIAVDPDFDPIRSDPRFAAVLHRIGLPLS
jgi:TolB-like protein/DNA-binding winged helix-turn-helix (wHTH) protein/Tfp pilus assembly protein PilF